MTDPMFRQRLRNYLRDVSDQMLKVEPGSRKWHKLEALERSIKAAHLECFGVAIQEGVSVPPGEK